MPLSESYSNPVRIDDIPVRIRSCEEVKEVGYYVPKTTSTTIPRLKTVIQTNDVDLDYRGLAYISDRAGTGLHIVEYLG